MHKKEIIIIGGGGHTRVLLGMLRAGGQAVRGIVTTNDALLGTRIMDIPVLGREGEVALTPEDVTLVNGVGNHPSRQGSGMAPRRLLYQRYRERGFDFLPILDPHAVVQPHTTLGAGAQIMPGAIIQPGANIGENVIINTRAAIDHDTLIHPHCHIAPGAVLCGHVVVGEATHIGAGAVILQDVTIGRQVVIAAGTIIRHNVDDGTIFAPSVTEQ